MFIVKITWDFKLKLLSLGLNLVDIGLFLMLNCSSSSREHFGILFA